MAAELGAVERLRVNVPATVRFVNAVCARLLPEQACWTAAPCIELVLHGSSGVEGDGESAAVVQAVQAAGAKGVVALAVPSALLNKVAAQLAQSGVKTALICQLDNSRPKDGISAAVAAKAAGVEYAVPLDQITAAHWSDMYASVEAIKCEAAQHNNNLPLTACIDAANVDDLASLTHLARAVLTCCAAGASAIKLSIQRPENATALLSASLVVLRIVREFNQSHSAQVQVKLSPCSAAVEHGDAASLLRLARADSGSEALTRVRLCVRTDDLQPEGAGTSQQQQQISKPAAADVDAIAAAAAAAAPRDRIFYPKPDALAPPARACERAETTSQPPPTTTSLMCYGTDYAAALRKPVQESQD